MQRAEGLLHFTAKKIEAQTESALIHLVKSISPSTDVYSSSLLSCMATFTDQVSIGFITAEQEILEVVNK